jgi:microsomal dipeptidase-like Zn-dependent dipeptidase
MINVNQITSMLSRMALPDLQKYAAMHKNDPYIVTLAMSVANQKKQADVAKNGLQGLQPQPKVVDQEIAQMAAPQMPPQQQMPPQMAQQQLPEDSGIGQLPAQNMQGMADGGIVGYAEGGYVPRFNGMTGSVPSANMFDITKMSPEDAKAYAKMLLEERNARANATVPSAPQGAGAANLSGYLSQLNKYAKAGIRNLPGISMATNLFGTSPEEIAILKQAELDRTLKGMPQSSISGTASAADVDKAIGLPPEAPVSAGPGAGPGAKPPTTKLPTATPTASSGQGIKTEPSAGLPSVAAFADQLMGIDKFLPKKEEAPVKETFMKEREDISRPVYEKATAMLEKEKSRLNEGKEQDFYMALIEGGLEAAAGNSPNGLQNLAAGFSKGAKSYSVALKDFRKAAQENSKMELDMERARAAEKRGDMDAFQKYEDSIKNRNADIDKLKTSGIFALQNVHTSGAYQLQSTGMTTSSQERIAKLNREAQASVAGMPNYIERMVNQMPGDTYADKLKAYSEIMGPNAKADSTMLMKYMGMTPAQKALFKRDNPQAAAGFDAQLQVSGLKPVNVSDALP